ncbi:MAG: hypothetical protein GC206_15570 [Alphaproteobacteria bacterium]|nr:hypothetical protein [Alphaproteobacteria bacterium]
MRFAAIATFAVAAIAAPFALSATAPSMNETEFVNAVQCVALDQAVSNGRDAAAVRGRLAFAQHDQSDGAIARARAEIGEVAALARTSDRDRLRPARDAVCGFGDVAHGNGNGGPA